MSNYGNYFLFGRPGFISGAAHIFDLGNTLLVYNESPNGEVADYMAIKNDWVVVGSDLWDAVEEAEHTTPIPDRQASFVG